MINILIVHYNTPELTEALCKSINKNVKECRIYIFDNSDKKPFVNTIPNCEVIDNTKGQIIDFDKWLKKFPLKMKTVNKWGSARHCKSVDICFDIIPDGFILMDSDILLKRDVSDLWDESKAWSGEVVNKPYRKTYKIENLQPMLLYVNVPLCKRNGVRFFNHHYMWALLEKKPNRYYDTGAYFLYACNRRGLEGNSIRIDDYMVHLGGASWKDKPQEEFLERNMYLYDTQCDKVRIYICAHTDFDKPVKSPVYKVIDMRDICGEECSNGLRPSFYCEIMHFRWVMEHERLPQYIGFCHYRRYWEFLDNIPDMDEIFKEYDCISSIPAVNPPSIADRYGHWHNREDIEIMREIVKEKFPDMYESYAAHMVSDKLYSCNMFIMRSKDFVELMHRIIIMLDEFVKRVGDIDERIHKYSKAYLKGGKSTEKYQYRMGGYLAERFTSAFINWKFPRVKQYDILLTGGRTWSLKDEEDKV